MRIPALALVFVTTLSSTASAVEFRFAPADGHECDQHLKSTVSTVVRSGGQVVAQREDKSDSVTHIRYEKTAGGYRITSRATSGEMSRDGKPVDDAIANLLKGRELTMEVGADGKATDVQGYDSLVKDMLAKMPPAAQAKMSSVLTPQALRDKDIADWNTKVASFLGKEAREGEVWEKQDEMPTSAGPMKYATVTRISKVETRQGRSLVTVDFAYENDGNAAKALMDKIGKALPTTDGAATVDVGKPTMHGTATRVVDAGTMDFETETETRIVTAPIQVPGKGPAIMERTEVKQYTLECSK